MNPGLGSLVHALMNFCHSTLPWVERKNTHGQQVSVHRTRDILLFLYVSFCNLMWYYICMYITYLSISVKFYIVPYILSLLVVRKKYLKLMTAIGMDNENFTVCSGVLSLLLIEVFSEFLQREINVTPAATASKSHLMYKCFLWFVE